MKPASRALPPAASKVNRRFRKYAVVVPQMKLTAFAACTHNPSPTRA
jgi:hypothetical protein